MGMNMAKMEEMKELSMSRFHHIETNELPDQIRAKVVQFVQENYSTEDIIRRVPKSVADAFMAEYLADTEQGLTRLHVGDSDVVILQEIPA